jgi:hypothetical protein
VGGGAPCVAGARCDACVQPCAWCVAGCTGGAWCVAMVRAWCMVQPGHAYGLQPYVHVFCMHYGGVAGRDYKQSRLSELFSAVLVRCAGQFYLYK